MPTTTTLTTEVEALIQEWIEIMVMADDLVALLVPVKWECRKLAGWTFDECMIHIVSHV